MDRKESDWRALRDMTGTLRERYLEKKNRELLATLTDTNKSPTEQFWDTHAQMGEEKKVLQRCLDDIRRSSMDVTMAVMLNHEMLLEEDLESFSPELQERLRNYLDVMSTVGDKA
ncbi:hypothetical protein [Rubritalea marina]|uniref:hypothetical protein n=1 Tax=Rubritalea marina TaxID=361055 RepID=UPI00037F4D07|nr:hypothetical protein [Rubritalea marina]